MTDDEAARNAGEDVDNPPAEASFWADAVLSPPMPPKVSVSIRLRRDVLDFFKLAGPGYQTRINDVLEAYVRHRKRQAAKKGQTARSDGPANRRAAG